MGDCFSSFFAVICVCCLAVYCYLCFVTFEVANSFTAIKASVWALALPAAHFTSM